MKKLVLVLSLGVVFSAHAGNYTPATPSLHLLDTGCYCVDWEDICDYTVAGGLCHKWLKRCAQTLCNVPAPEPTPTYPSQPEPTYPSQPEEPTPTEPSSGSEE